MVECEQVLVRVWRVTVPEVEGGWTSGGEPANSDVLKTPNSKVIHGTKNNGKIIS